jgi:hypothetical protein
VTTTDDARLLEIEAREQAATPGPWTIDDLSGDLSDEKEWCGDEPRDGCTEDSCTGHLVEEFCWIEGPAYTDAGEGLYWKRADADFVQHSREDVRFLLDRLKAAESRIRELERIAEDALGLMRSVADARKDSENVTAAIAMESVARHLRQRLTTLHSNEVQGGV